MGHMSLADVAYRVAHHAEHLAYCHAYRLTHHEEEAAKAKSPSRRQKANERNKAHPLQMRAAREKYEKSHPGKLADMISEWKREHPERLRLSCEKRRALKFANTPLNEMLTSTEWLTILAEANGHCHYCDKVSKLTLDHVFPLSKGGKHSKDNIVAACKHCNSSKGVRTLGEWREEVIQ